MPTDPYLWRLTKQLTEGLARLPDDARQRHASYLRSLQNPDGGYSGREGDSDLYYTSFGLRGLAVLGALDAAITDRAAGYLRRSLTEHASIIDFLSLLYSCFLVQATGGPDVLAGSPPDWPDRVAATLETFRVKDGGYAKTAGGVSGSTYHTFLVGLCYQLLGKPVPQPTEVERFLASRQRDDGGFVEIGAMRRSGTNPTAAAVGMYQILTDRTPEGVPQAPSSSPRGGSEGAWREPVIDFLAAMPSLEGGLRANDRAPLADLLSTFTGVWTLHQLSALDRVNRNELRAYVESLELADGGFKGGLWDNRADVEYTFYGLGSLAIL
jgi:geranylgeranyl transferase type-2 subunit beta